jgi:putative transposase
MQRFKSAEQAQRFLEPFSTVCNHFRPRRHRLRATAYRRLMDEQRQIWREVTAAPAAR